MAIPIWVVGFAMLAGYLAGHHRRSVTVWTCFGAIIGPLAALLLIMAPPGRCRSCTAEVLGWSDRCSMCGRDVRTGAAIAPRPREPASRRQATPAPVVTADPPVAQTAAPVAPVAPATRAVIPRSDDPGPSTNGREATVPVAMPPLAPVALGRTVLDGGAFVVATGVYVTGSVALQPGCHYAIEIDGPVLRVRGPLDSSPTAVALERRLERLQADTAEERLIITEGKPTATGTVLVFMAVSRAGDELPAVAIQRAATALREGHG